MTNSLPGVPEELRIKILSFLDAIALARCSMVWSYLFLILSLISKAIIECARF
jgi:hypothetical protein